MSGDLGSADLDSVCLSGSEAISMSEGTADIESVAMNGDGTELVSRCGSV